MDIKKTANGSALTIAVIGRLDTTTAPQLDAEVRALPADVMDLTFDFADLEYVSSAGLRVILVSQKTMSARGGRMKVVGANACVRDVFDITGFSSIIAFE